MKIEVDIKDEVAHMTIGGRIGDDPAVFENHQIDITKIKTVEIQCENVESINSMGIMNWINYFSAMRKGGLKLHFHRCSPAVVRQAGMMMRQFMEASEAVSIALPYACFSCAKDDICKKTDFVEVKKLKENGFKRAEHRCLDCDGSFELDEMEELYFQLFKT